MAEYVEKHKIINILTALENEFQQYKPFKGFENAMYRKLCETEITIGKLPAADVIPKQGWVRLTEQLPPIGEDVVLYCNTGLKFGFRKEDGWCLKDMTAPGFIMAWLPVSAVPETIWAVPRKMRENNET